MLVAVATVIHRVFTYDKSLSTTIFSGIALFVFMAAFSAWHCIEDEMTMHSCLFGVYSAKPLCYADWNALEEWFENGNADAK